MDRATSLLLKDPSVEPPLLFLQVMRLENKSPEIQATAWKLSKKWKKLVPLKKVLNHITRRSRVKAGREEMTAEYGDHDNIGEVESHFLDSGAFALWSRAAKYHQLHKGGRWDFYDTPEFWEYADSYADFVKKNRIAIDLYANIDVIPEPKLTWRNQRYLEKKHGLEPVPVVHYTTDLKWLQFYIDKGYPLIGLGGLVGSSMKDGCRQWLDRAFDMVCSTKDRKPAVKIHGFGVTSYQLLLRYPWWSVDSASWTKVSAYGGICVPHKRNSKFIFTEPPYIIKVSHDSGEREQAGKHYLTLAEGERAVVREWLKSIQIPLGKFGPEGEVLEFGVMTHHAERRAANLIFFEQLRNSLPEYPWEFRAVHQRRGFRR